MKSMSLIAGLVAFTLSHGVNAQVAQHPWSQTQDEAQAQIAFTVPLGHSPSANDTEPRVELIVRQRLASGEFAALRRADDERWNERRLGLLLGANGRLLLNGRAIVREERRDGIQDGVLIAGGIVLTTLVLSALLLDVDSSAGDN